MYKLLVLFFMAISACCFGQSDLAKDSFALVNKKGVFYVARYTETDNGAWNDNGNPIGDTLSALNYFVTNYQSEASRLAADVDIVSRYTAAVNEMIRAEKAVKATVGKSPFDSLRRLEPLLIQSGWQVKDGSVLIPFRFRTTAAGAFQWRSDTSNVWRTAVYIGSILRLTGFGGNNIDFYKSRNKWFTLDRRYFILPPGVSARTFKED